MTRWHTDAPIRPVPRLGSLASSQAIDEFRSDYPASRAVRIAHAYWMRKLRKRAESHEGGQGDAG